MKLVRLENPAAARDWCVQRREEGRSIGFVATMGALHRGHMTLVRQAAQENDLVVVSVFVNPLQFNDSTDLERYPRDIEGDCARVEEAGGRCSSVAPLRAFSLGKSKRMESFSPPQWWIQGALPSG